MKNIRKTLAALLVIAMLILPLAACKDNGNEGPQTSEMLLSQRRRRRPLRPRGTIPRDVNMTDTPTAYSAMTPKSRAVG